MSSLPLIVNILYFSGLFQFSFITLVSFKPDIITWPGSCPRLLFFFYQASASFMSDLPLHHAFLQLFFVYITWLCGGLEDSWMKWTLVFVQLPTILFEFVLFSKIFEDKKQVEKSLDQIKLHLVLPNVFSWFWLKRVINPVWKPKQIKKDKDISYITEREIQGDYRFCDDKDLKRLTLNVISSEIPSGGLKPVLVHLNGEFWTSATKDIFYPYQKLLVQEDGWVIVNVNYRLAPKHPYPAHLLDCKRAIRWVKQNIEKYGGDSKRVVIAGDSTGSHLAGMIAFTANEPEYQSDFKDVDTSVIGYITFNGVLRLEHYTDITRFVSEVICSQSPIDDDYIKRNSPYRLKDNTPTLLLSGSKDRLVEEYQSATFFGYRFVNDVVAVGDHCQLVSLPYAHHYFYRLWSPRSIYTAKLIQAWCKNLTSND